MLIGELGLSSLQKYIATMCILASSAPDEYVQLALSTFMHSLKQFAWATQALYESTYLRQPTKEDLENK
jgi:hypothetical protein